MAKRTTATKSGGRRSKSSGTTKTASRKAKSSTTKRSATAKSSTGDTEVTIDRRLKATRRVRDSAEVATEGSQPAPKLERRKKVNRRRQIDPTTCERDYTEDEIEFMNALDEYKRASGRMFPTCSEVLEVVRSIGYMKLSPAEQAAYTADTAELTAESPTELAGQTCSVSC